MAIFAVMIGLALFVPGHAHFPPRFSFRIQQPFAINLGTQSFVSVTIAVPDMETGQKFAKSLIQQKMAALVNINPNIIAVYKWDDEIKELPEVIMNIYTHASQVGNIEKFIDKYHVHIEPGVVAVPIVAGSSSFLAWLKNSLGDDDKPKMA